MAKRPVSAMGNKRPISEYAKRAAALGGNPRYKVNLIVLKIQKLQEILKICN